MNITFNNVSFKYIDKYILKNASFSITDSDKIGIIGVNGTGKTTLLKLILEIEKPLSGEIMNTGGIRINYLPQDVEEGTRLVSAISPGVLGTTGIETVEILKGIVDNINPKLVIVIDALASRSIERISSTVQLSDTGIVPGAGVGNTRSEISKTTLGIPVIAIGIPTVVELATLVSDGIDIFIDRLQDKAESNEYLNKLQQDDKYEEVKEALNVGEYNMIVTPKEIDQLIENMEEIISKGINMSL